MRRPIKPLCVLAITSVMALIAHAQETLPADVHPDSRSRLPSLGSDAPTGVEGIIASGSGALVRWEFALGRPLSELAILTTAREFDQPYEWSLHELEALAVGLQPQVIELVRNRLSVAGISDNEAVIVQMGREIYGEHELSAETYARAERLLGRTNLVDIVMLMGEYAEDAVRLTAFNQYMPSGWAQFLPLPFTQPDDIHPDSRSRLPYLRNEIRAAGATPSLYGRGLAPEGTGPGQIMRRSRDVQALQASVGSRLVRLARLIAARELDDSYQWTMNEIAAAEEGLEPVVIGLVRQRAPVTNLADKDAALIEFGREVLTEHTVKPATYSRALELFGETDLVGFVNVMAKSASDSALLIAFQQQLPPGQEPLL
jgi:4-carboxymuconolactone decarboxylase